MVISGERVRCANCGMIYERPPAENVFWIGVPFLVNGSMFCPGCGSNAADPILMPSTFATGTTDISVTIKPAGERRGEIGTISRLGEFTKLAEFTETGGEA